MVTVACTRRCGLPVTPVSGAFSTASGDTVQLLGTTTMTLQVHDHLQLVLEGVRVHQPQQEDAYLFLLGNDVLGGVDGMLGAAVIQSGACVQWWDPRRSMGLVSKVTNPRPVQGGHQLVMTAAVMPDSYLPGPPAGGAPKKLRWVDEMDNWAPE